MKKQESVLMNRMDTYDIDTETLNKYITQQEKKDELLELYKKLLKYIGFIQFIYLLH